MREKGEPLKFVGFESSFWEGGGGLGSVREKEGTVRVPWFLV